MKIHTHALGMHAFHTKGISSSTSSVEVPIRLGQLARVLKLLTSKHYGKRQYVALMLIHRDAELNPDAVVEASYTRRLLFNLSLYSVLKGYI